MQQGSFIIKFGLSGGYVGETPPNVERMSTPGRPAYPGHYIRKMDHEHKEHARA